MDNKEKLPNQLKPLYESLDKEVIWIHAKWKIYKQLFGADEEIVEILNRTAPFFFRVVQNVIFEDTLLAISRLTDLSKTKGKENRSLRQFADKTAALGLTELSSFLLEILNNDIDTKCKAFRDWRNRRIAHSDLSTALQVTNEPLPGISRLMIEDVLFSIRHFMNSVNGYFFGSETGYEHFLMVTGGDHLMRLLQRAEDIQQQERAEIENENRSD